MYVAFLRQSSFCHKSFFVNKQIFDKTLSRALKWVDQFFNSFNFIFVEKMLSSTIVVFSLLLFIGKLGGPAGRRSFLQLVKFTHVSGQNLSYYFCYILPPHASAANWAVRRAGGLNRDSGRWRGGALVQGLVHWGGGNCYFLKLISYKTDM